MPRTCETKAKIKNKKDHNRHVKIHNIILCLSHPSYRPLLQTLVHDAICDVSNSFQGIEEETSRMQTIYTTSSHNTLLVMFFLLLNVDPNLKNKIMLMDSDANMAKTTRFLCDLRKILAVQFYTDETFTPSLFVEACVDCYIIS